MSSKSVGLLQKEQFRGGVSSLVCGTVAGVLTMVGVDMGLPAPQSAAIFLYGVGSLLSYVVDNIFAKSHFPNAKGVVVPLAYDEYSKRIAYTLRSFLTNTFFKYLILVCVDTIMGIALLKAAIKYMNNNKILMGWKYRDTSVAVGIAMFTYILYLGHVRYLWALVSDHDPIIHIVILVWVSLALLIFALTYVNSTDTPENPAQTNNWLLDVVNSS